MPTPNFNFPTINGNNTADVVRDLNGLAEAVDTSLASHTNASPSAKHSAGEISFSPGGGLSATNTQAAILEAFQYGNNVKADVVAALLALAPELPINPNSSWVEVEEAIANISTGKKFSVGTTTLTGNPAQQKFLVVSGLDFTPELVFATSRIGTHNTLTAVISIPGSGIRAQGVKTLIDSLGAGYEYSIGETELTLGAFALSIPANRSSNVNNGEYSYVTFGN